MNQEVLGSSPLGSSKEFLDIQGNIKCEFTVKDLRDMIRT